MSKNLPCNLEAEKATLGSILIDQNVAHLVFPVLRAEHFFDERNRMIYQAMVELESVSKPSDYITETNKWVTDNPEQAGTGSAYIVELMQSTPSSLHAEHYATIVRNYYKLRQLILSTTKILDTAYKADTENINFILDEAASLLYNLFRDDADKSVATARDMMEEYWDNLEIRYANPLLAEFSTGFQELDAVTAGYVPGDLIVIAGRPSWGKTSFMMSSILHLGKAGVPCAMFPYEMSRLQTSQRFVSMMSNVPLVKAKSAVGLTTDDLVKMTEAVSEFSKYPIYADSNSSGDIYYLVAAIRAYVSRHNIKVVFIDYLQIIPTYTDDLTNEYGRITRTLKTLATSLNITIVLVSQLNRAIESRAERKPQLSDLRQSGRIEEDADIVLFVFRDVDSDTPEVTDLMVSKNRNGPRGGSISLLFDPETTHFVGRTL
jgi:replicative DNA helicase